MLGDHTVAHLAHDDPALLQVGRLGSKELSALTLAYTFYNLTGLSM